jgi:tetratricopeptide repeat protein
MPFLRYFRHALAVALVGLSAAACNSSINTIKFPVQENGRSVKVTKFFHDGFGGSEPNRAFRAAQQNDFPGAVAIMRVLSQESPRNYWYRYDLAILYEATGHWPEAEVEMSEGLRLIKEAEVDSPIDLKKFEAMFADELSFIQRRKAVAASGA